MTVNANAAELIRRTRKRHGISQRSLALRAATGQAAISRIERGEVSPSVDTVERLLAAMGERLQLESESLERDHDPLHVRAALQRTPAERLELAISWNRLAGRLTEAGRRASAGEEIDATDPEAGPGKR
jgi:transcriptional regulator with XRE-family HTH domain